MKRKRICVLTKEDVNDWERYWKEFFYEYSTDVAEGALSLIATIRNQEKQLAKYESIVESAKSWHEAFNEEYGDRCIPMHPTAQNLHDAIKALEVK